MMKQIKSFNLTLLFAFFATTLFANNNYPAPTDIAKAYFTHLDAGNFAELDKIIADELAATAPFAPQPLSKQAWMGVGQGFKAAFPDMKHEIVSAIESGYSVAVRGVFSGQNTGPMMGNPATGNRVRVSFTTVFELDKTWKIKAVDVQFDNKSFEAQLMAGLPDPDAAAEATVRAIMAASDAGDAEKLASYFAADARHYFSGVANTNEELKKRVLGFKAGFPDIKRDIQVVGSHNGLVTIRGWLTGTNTEPFMGKPATGNKIKASALGIYQINAQGKVTEAWVELDTAAIMAQLQGGSTSVK